MGNVAAGDFSRKNAENAYRESIELLWKVDRFRFIAALEINGPGQPGQDGSRDTPKKTSKHRDTMSPLDPEIILHGLFSR
jgi:hypothetical protein